MPARHRLDRYDEHGQDTWVSPDEESFAAEMGQPSTEPNPAHETTFPKGWGERRVDEISAEELQELPPAHGRHLPMPRPHPAVLCQTPVTCQKCGRQAIPFEDVIVCVDGGWLHDECHELDG